MRERVEIGAIWFLVDADATGALVVIGATSALVGVGAAGTLAGRRERPLGCAPRALVEVGALVRRCELVGALIMEVGAIGPLKKRNSILLIIRLPGMPRGVFVTQRLGVPRGAPISLRRPT